MGVWSEFCRELERAGAVVERANTPGHEIDRAEGYRYLSRPLRIGFDPESRRIAALREDEISVDDDDHIEVHIGGGSRGSNTLRSTDHSNNRTAHVEPDGQVRAVISMRRPSTPNWIDTLGHRVGALVFRWSHTYLPLPSITTRVVPLSSLDGGWPTE